MKTPRLSNIKPIKNLSQVDKIEISLQEYFRSENFLPGDSIPTELELANAMGVSRTAIREAISRFKMLGIIESKKNRGMIITRPDVLNNMQRLMDPQLLAGDTMKEIFEMRLVVEVGIADLLFLRKTKANLAKLEKIVDLEDRTKNKLERLKYDIEFHAMLYKISGNETICRFQEMLLPVFNYVDHGLHMIKSRGSDRRISHRVLLDVLRNGTPEEFRSKMRDHLNNYFEKISEMLPGETKSRPNGARRLKPDTPLQA